MRFLAVFALLFGFLHAEVMLLKEYKDENLSGWVMSEKFDGVRAIWDGKNLKSKNGKIINAPIWWLESFPPFMIDGELWSQRGEFEKITSIVSDAHPSNEWQSIKFMIFDLPQVSGNLQARLEILRKFLAKNPNKFINVIDQKPVSSNQMAFDFLDDVTAIGGEGIVVRDPNAAYIGGRSSKILKLKKFKDSECEVVELRKGNGKYAGVLGSLVCKDIFSGVSFKIGSGFSDFQRANPPKIGSIITYKYQNLTKFNKPRFPVFLRVKSDIILSK
ncbi:DNA ligase [Campylobacter iguaniorum]|uniref:DNA ligase n=1 Tax=Campylobacter iguaniorum TaxID=1244531 RepID=A0A076FAH4_9BACT|nr:DNA ligase [Campylobacter iguaniorum]AII15225.1 DNA ligase [Campylobacter iguaniorum]ALV25148.1 DNA ligase [Campylobacter iguaniorum]